MGKRKTFSKVVSWLLIWAMVVTVLPANLAVVAKAAGTTTLTAHIKVDEVLNWEQVCVKIGGGSSWTKLKNYEFVGDDKGGCVSANTVNAGWYSFRLTLDASDVASYAGEDDAKGINGLFNCGEWGGTNQTENFHISVTEGVDNEVWFSTEASSVNAGGNLTLSKSKEAPAQWNPEFIATEPAKASTEPTDPGSEIGYESPKINADNSVTIQYDMNDAATSYKEDTGLMLMGTITDWSVGKEMELKDGIYSLTINKPDASASDIVVAPGKYTYKFKSASDDNVWFTDPANTETEGGNSVVYVPGMVVTGNNTAGSGTFDLAADYLYAGDVEANITQWAVSSSGTEKTAYPGLSIQADGADSAKAVLTATDDASSGYYYVWVSYKVGDSQEINTEIVKYYHTKRAVIYEYTYHEDSPYKAENQSDFYAWYNVKEEGFYKFLPVGETGKLAAYVPVDDATTSFGYIVRLYSAWSGDDVSDREYKDRTLNIHEGERYTKVRGGEGIGEPYVLQSGKTGYQDGILFKYRDDALFYKGAMDTIESAKVMVKAPGEENFTAYPMEYSTEDELFTYGMKNGAEKLAAGNYEFYFLVDFGAGETAVADYYFVPEVHESAEGVAVAEISYANPDYEIKTSVTPEKGASYDENPVVTVEITRGETSDKINALNQGEIASITADISQLGMEGETVEISPVTGKAALYISEKATAGNKKVPIQITDIYGNKYAAETTVKVIANTGKDSDWDESIIYFLLTDRFYNGKETNDFGADKSIREDYHGGDFAGLTEKLDYIDELGVNTIWITPIVDNIDSFQSDETHTSVGGYAGYWACDFTKIDEHLGTTEEFATLLDEAHERGIKVMLDVVVNHAGYDKVTGNKEWISQNPELSQFSGMIRPYDAQGSDSITTWLSDLPDFVTEKQAIRSQLITWQKSWAEFTTEAGNSVDYFRVDTVKHVEHETWSQLKSEIAEENPDFKMIGEYFGANYTNTGGYLADGQMDALLDFDFKSLANQFVNGKVSSVETALETRNVNLNSAVTMGQFLSSHDENGFLYSVGGDTGKMKVAAALEMTAKGQPIIYYGEEINLTGNTEYGSDDNNRYDMQFENLTAEQSAMLTHYKKLIAARNAKTDVFAKGNRIKIAGNDAAGYLVVKRSYGSDYVYVALNTTKTAKQVTLSVDANLANMKELYSGKTVVVNNGKVTITIPANTDGGTVILAAGSKKETIINRDDKKEDVSETPQPQAIGSEINVADKKAKVSVTSSDPAAPTVTYEGTTDKKTKKIVIPDTVTVDGITYSNFPPEIRA